MCHGDSMVTHSRIVGNHATGDWTTASGIAGGVSMDGISMLKELRKDAWGKDVPVIILTNLNDASKVGEAVDQGVQDYLVKVDWKMEDLVIKVKQKLGI